MKKGVLLVLSGPSGVGKSTAVAELMRHRPQLRFSISATTRPARPGEMDGVHYYFKSRAEFDAMVARGALLEHAEYVGNGYGTPAAPVDKLLCEGYDVLLDIEVQGAMQVKRARPDAVLVFLAAPSFEELERRLNGRGDTAPELVQRRLETARREFQFADRYDYLVVSDKVEKTAGELDAIFTAEHCRTSANFTQRKEE
ncbi:MAG: guanylate kinase [Oscillospiraceae bacterium]|nr:guanylate kinase [Oscillospiraceae bacterium]